MTIASVVAAILRACHAQIGFDAHYCEAPVFLKPSQSLLQSVGAAHAAKQTHDTDRRNQADGHSDHQFHQSEAGTTGPVGGQVHSCGRYLAHG